MSFYLLQPLFIFLLAIFQITVLDFLSLGMISIDLTLAFAIYAGLHIGALRGLLLSFLLGFLLDCTLSPIWGMHMFLYTFFFYLSFLASSSINKATPLPATLFTGACFFLQGVLKVFFYWAFLGISILSTLPSVFLPQAVVMGFISPFLFYFFNYTEALFNAEVRQPARRL